MGGHVIGTLGYSGCTRSLDNKHDRFHSFLLYTHIFLSYAIAHAHLHISYPLSSSALHV